MRFTSALWGTALVSILACSAGGGDDSDSHGGKDGDKAGSEALGNCDEGTCFQDLSNVPTPPGCGNGELTEDEACDDGNKDDGDGCAADCLSVDPGFTCSTPGEACRPFARCGDGVLVPPEPCDDGNTEGGDGCSSHCRIELGFKCEGEPSDCTPTTCGDGKQEGAESCDDGNTQPFDGCSSLCQTEPDCSGEACTSSCGDGLVIDEECDDGNNTDGDGCSANCEKELGFECSQDLACEEVNGACVLRVPAIFRDFNESHSDFQTNCRTEQMGIVEPMLNADGRPVLANGNGACIESAQSFNEWYTDNANNSTIVGDIVLFDNEEGGFVNRYGANGEKWTALANALWVNASYTACAPDCLPCPWDANVGCSADIIEYDGNPLFFPIDDHPDALADARGEAKIPAQYGYDSWPWEKEVVPGAGLHNFHFTTEVQYWFKYDAAGTAKLDFTGDDDVWVFVNGQLAVDLGGIHVPLDGSVTIDDAASGTYDLEDGKVYKISVFHAERKMEGSSFRLTLDGFSSARSECLPICGDGIVGLGEECDDGENDGGYGECAEGCTLGEYCGDGIVQDGEDCDDGNRRDGDECGSACRVLIIR